MPRLVTLTELVTRVREEADMTGSTFRSDERIGIMVRSAVRELWDLLIASRGEDYYLTTAAIVAGVGDRLNELPDDFYRLVSVCRVDGSRLIRMRRFGTRDVAALTSLGSSEVCWYRVRGKGHPASPGAGEPLAHLELLPVPTATVTLQIEYVPTCEGWDDGANERTFDGIHGWEEFAVFRVAGDLLAQERSDPSYCLRRCDELRDRIRALADGRDVSDTPRVVDDRPDAESSIFHEGRRTWA